MQKNKNHRLRENKQNTPNAATEYSFNTNGAAEELNLSPRTLERWRLEGKGPSYCKFGSRVIYTGSQLSEYKKQNTHTSTSDGA